MRKSTKALLVGAALTAALTISAGAANFTDCADTLNSMDLFSGTQLGYELDRAPTRAEASVMLVRLLGGEKEATANTYETPFTDVPTWAQPYVGWLYENKLTAGATATTFDPQSQCTAQMYSAFLLRSLGYSEAAGDFTYATAVDYATEKGVADYLNCSTDHFLRDNVVAMSYTALSVQPKDKAHDTLLDQLVAEGAIDAAKAAPVQKDFATFREYDEVVRKANQQTKMDMTMKLSGNVKAAGMNIMDIAVDMDMKADMNLEKMDSSKMAMLMKMAMSFDPALGMEENDISMDAEMYYSDGHMYQNMAGQKIKYAMSFDDIMASMGDLMTTQSNPITFYDSITKNSDGSYDIVYSGDAYSGMMDSIMGMMGMESLGLKFDKLACSQKISKDGNLDSMKMDMAMSMTMEGETMDIAVTVDCKSNAFGSAVKVTLPSDLSSYELVEMP